MIEVKNVKKRYGPFEALKDVSFSVREGEILGFLGPNGAGKTTMMRILTGYFPPTEGQILIKGLNFEDNTLALQRLIGYLPENVPLYPEMRVRDYLAFVGMIKGLRGITHSQEIEKVLRQCGLQEVQRRQIRKLSKGYKQRTGLAQALLGDPEILILDEPTTGLDPRQIIEIRSLIKSMAGKKTVILSSHILPEVSTVCDRVIIINEGIMVAEDTPSDLQAKLQSQLEVRVQLRGNQEAALKEISHVSGVSAVKHISSSQDAHEFMVSSETDKDIRPDLARLLSKKFDLLELTANRLSLEDIFLKLVTDETVGAETELAE